MIRTLAALAGCAVFLPGTSCARVDEALNAALAQLSVLAEAASKHRAALERRLLRRDDLGPGEYRTRLRAAHADALRALDLEEESRVASLLAQLANVVTSSGSDGRRLLATRLSASLAPILSFEGFSLSRAALEHATSSQSRARALRRRAASAARDLGTLRVRLVALRKALARSRLSIAESLGVLGDVRHGAAAELLQLARSHALRVGELRPGPLSDGERVSFEAFSFRGSAPAAARTLAFARALGRRVGVSIDSLELSTAGRRAEVRARVRMARLRPGTDPLAASPITSTPAALERLLAEAEGWREALASAITPEPGPAQALDAIASALGDSGTVARFAASAGQFSATLRASRSAAARITRALARAQGLSSVSPNVTRDRIALRGRYRTAVDEPVVVAPPADAHAPAKHAGPTRARVALRTPTTPHAPISAASAPPERIDGEGAWRLVGVASAANGTVRAVIRDGQGRAHIIKVGSELEDGSKVTRIHRDAVTARRGDRIVHIRTAE
jgi:hypothetical protein